MKNFLKLIITLSFVLSLNLSAIAGPMDDLLINGAMNNDIEMMGQALDNGTDINYRRGPDSALNLAVSRNHLNSVSFLLHKGASIDIGATGGGRNNQTNLMLAAYNGNYEMVKLLISAGENINAVDRDRNTAIAIYFMRIAPKANVTKALVDGKADVNKANKYGLTPLMLFAKNSAEVNGAEIDCLNILLKAGANPAARDNQGKTALHYAIERNNKAAINILLPISPKQ